MQNAKCQLLWNDEMQNAKTFIGVFSSIQNAKFFMVWVRAFWFFFCPLEVKIQNGEWIFFYQKFCMVFSSILQNDGPKPKIFWVKWETKHTLTRIGSSMRVAFALLHPSPFPLLHVLLCSWRRPASLPVSDPVPSGPFSLLQCLVYYIESIHEK